MGVCQVSDVTVSEQGRMQPLSKTWVYGVTWDGERLAVGHLTSQSLWQMRTNARKNQKKRVEYKAQSRSAAVGGFELMLQIAGNAKLISEASPKVILAWAEYLTYTKLFKELRDIVFPEGVHLILIGWATQDGHFHLKPKIAVFERILTAEQIKEIVNGVMADEFMNRPHLIPIDYKAISE